MKTRHLFALRLNTNKLETAPVLLGQKTANSLILRRRYPNRDRSPSSLWECLVLRRKDAKELASIQPPPSKTDGYSKSTQHKPGRCQAFFVPVIRRWIQICGWNQFKVGWNNKTFLIFQSQYSKLLSSNHNTTKTSANQITVSQSAKLWFVFLHIEFRNITFLNIFFLNIMLVIYN